MSYFKPAMLLTAASLMSGCANFSPLFSDDVIEEAPKQTTSELKVPESLSSPTKSSEFHLLEGSRTAKRSEKLTSPSSILEIYPGSWVNKDDPHPYKIIIEKPNHIENLRGFIETSVLALIEGRGYDISKSTSGNIDTYRVVANKIKETGFWFWSGETKTELFEFDLVVDTKPHGRTAEVSVNPITYKKLNKERAPKFNSAVRTEQLAVEMVNQFSIELSFQDRLMNQRNNASQRVTLTLGTNSARESVITSQYEIRKVFKEFYDVITALGFNLEEEDDKLYAYTVTYDKDDNSILNRIFDSKYARQLDLEKGTYEVVFMSSVDGVHIAFTDESGTALSEEKMKAIYDLAIKYANEEELKL